MPRGSQSVGWSLHTRRGGLAVAAALASVSMAAFTPGGAAGAAPSNSPFYKVTASIALDRPRITAIDAAAHRAYVTQSADNEVSVIDLTTDTVVDTITVGSFPLGIAVDPVRHRAYVVSDTNSGTVSIIDTGTDTVVGTIGVGQYPHFIDVDPSEGLGYVTNSNSVSVIDLDTDTTTQTLAITDPVNVAVDETHHLAYVLGEHEDGSGTVSTVDEDTLSVTATIDIAARSYPLGLAIDPETHTTYVSDQSNHIFVIDQDTNSIEATISAGRGADTAAVDPDLHRLLVGNLNDNTVSVINTLTNTVVSTVGGFNLPYSVTIDPTTHAAYVSNVSGNSLSVLSYVQRATVTGVSPATGPTAGGQQVTITGQHFTAASKVVFGNVPASQFTVDSDTQITATTPAQEAGVVKVRVQTAGLSAKSADSRYRYTN